MLTLQLYKQQCSIVRTYWQKKNHHYNLSSRLHLLPPLPPLEFCGPEKLEIIILMLEFTAARVSSSLRVSRKCTDAASCETMSTIAAPGPNRMYAGSKLYLEALK